jgi:hypothetical protein
LNFCLQAIGILEKPKIETNIRVCNLDHVFIHKNKELGSKTMIYELKEILETKIIKLTTLIKLMQFLSKHLK